MNKRKYNVKVLWPILMVMGLAVTFFSFFQLTYAYHLFFKGQNQLFLMSWSYVSTLFAKPAWVACLAGEFLTQFFYYKIAGAAILTAVLTGLLGLSYWTVYRLVPKRMIAMAVALLVTVREASCHLYFGYVLSSTFALIGGLLMFLALRRLMSFRWPCVLAALVPGTVICYWMFGYGVWVFLLLSAIAVWRVAVPVAVVFVCLLPLVRSHYNLNFMDLSLYPGIGSWHAPAWDREKDFHMMHSYEVGDWDDVVVTAENDPLLDRLKDHVSSQAVLTDEERISSSVRLFFYNLVLAQRGKLPDVLLNYYPNYLGTFTSMVGQKIPMMLFMNMHEYYYAIGDMSYAERGAFMSCVCVPGNRNVYDIKRLAECELVKNDKKPAGKYLGLLSQTIPYRGWAERAWNDDQYKQKAEFVNRQDSVSPNDNSHRIMTQLLRSNPKNEVALDYMLCSLLQVKEIDNFKRDYDLFCTAEPRIRKLYQEALCIWLVNHATSEEEWQKYIQDEQILKRLEEYMADKGNPRFADTYWYYYDVYNFVAY